jgi:hypothetical protein
LLVSDYNERQYLDYFISDNDIGVFVASGRVQHDAIGVPVTSSCASSGEGKLTDGLTGSQNPFDRKWKLFSNNVGGVCRLSLTFPSSVNVSVVAVNFLQVSQTWFVNGDGLNPMLRNTTAYLPSVVRVFLDGVMQYDASPIWWSQEYYDIRNQQFVLYMNKTSPTTTVAVEFKVAAPKWALSTAPAVFYAMLDEIIINPKLVK